MIQMSKKKKIVIIIVLSILVTLFTILSTVRMFSPKEVETEDITYEYNFTGGLDYEVYLKPNNIYDENPLESNRQYILQLTDYINITCKLDFNATESSKITYNYVVYPSIEAITGSDENEDILWKKNYPVISSRRKQLVNNKFAVNDQVELYLDEYLAFVDEVYNDLEINSNDNLVLNFEGTVLIEYNGNIISEKFSQRVHIPLTQKLYRIQNDDNFEIGDSVIESNIESIKVNLLAIVGLVISIVLLVISVKLINVLPPLNRKEIIFKRILNEHSERLVKLTSFTYDIHELIFVNEFKDLLKIADEISQPIFYCEIKRNEVRTIQFLVFDVGKNYSFSL